MTNVSFYICYRLLLRKATSPAKDTRGIPDYIHYSNTFSFVSELWAVCFLKKLMALQIRHISGRLLLPWAYDIHIVALQARSFSRV